MQRPLAAADMHLLPTTTVALDDDTAVDLGQPPGDIVVLSFTDSDLGALASAQASASGRAVAAPCLAAAPAPSPFGRSLCRRDRRQMPLRGRALPRRPGILALWRGAALGNLSGRRHTARGAAGRRPAGSPALRLFDNHRRAWCGTRRLFPRGRRREHGTAPRSPRQAISTARAPLPAPPEPVPRAFAWSPRMRRARAASGGAAAPPAAAPWRSSSSIGRPILAGDTRRSRRSRRPLASPRRWHALVACRVEPEGPGGRRLSPRRDPRAADPRDRHDHCLFGARGRRLRPRCGRLPGPAGHPRRQRAGGLGSLAAGPLGGRSRDAGRAAGIRRPHRRRAVAFKAERDPDPALAFARPASRARSRPASRAPPIGRAWVAPRATPAAERRLGARAVRLSGPRRPRRLRRRPRHAGERRRHPRLPRERRLRVSRHVRRPIP